MVKDYISKVMTFSKVLSQLFFTLIVPRPVLSFYSSNAAEKSQWPRKRGTLLKLIGTGIRAA